MATYRHGQLKILANAARARGLHRFWSPKPCGKGHVGYRYISSYMCVTCNYDYHVRYNARAAAAKMAKTFDSEALKGASSEATREQSDFLDAVIMLRRDLDGPPPPGDANMGKGQSSLPIPAPAGKPPRGQGPKTRRKPNA